MKPIIKNVANRPAYILRNANVELAVTRDGAHMAPVNFYRDTGKPVQPYLVSAWQGEKPFPKCQHKVEELLRGDFFCLPFGGGSLGEDGGVVEDGVRRERDYGIMGFGDYGRE